MTKRKENPKRTGRPAGYNAKYHPKQARAMAFHGLTNPKIADVFGITRETIGAWIEKYPEFSDALHKGRNDDILALSKSLAKKAHGYKVKETKRVIAPAHQRTDLVPDLDKPGHFKAVVTDVPDTVIEVVEITKTAAPDPAALRFLLTNRAPNEWREAAHIDHTTNGKDINDKNLDLSKLTDEEVAEMARIEQKAKA